MARRGRRSKAEEAIRVKALMNDPGAQKSNMFQVDRGYPVVEGDAVIDKEIGLTVLVSERIKTLLGDPKISLTSPAFSRPWLSADTPEKVITQLKQESHINKRIIETLEHHLAMHVIAQGSIDRQMAEAREELYGDMAPVPKSLQTFARMQHLAGLKATSVSGMSMPDHQALAHLLNNRGALEPSEMPIEIASMARPSNRATPEQIEEANASSARITEEGAIARGQRDEGVLPPREPVLTVYGQSWNDPVAEVPEEFWCSNLDFDMPYRWEFRTAEGAEVQEVMGMPLPPHDSWEKMVKREAEFRQGFKGEITDFAETADLLPGYLGNICGKDWKQVPENWVKAWLYLLWARTRPENVKALMGDKHRTYFAGTMIPVRTTGPSTLRFLVPIADPGAA